MWLYVDPGHSVLPLWLWLGRWTRGRGSGSVKGTARCACHVEGGKGLAFTTRVSVKRANRRLFDRSSASDGVQHVPGDPGAWCSDTPTRSSDGTEPRGRPAACARVERGRRMTGEGQPKRQDDGRSAMLTNGGHRPLAHPLPRLLIRGWGGWHDAWLCCCLQLASAHCPSLEPAPSAGGGAYRPLTASCPPSPCLASP